MDIDLHHHVVIGHHAVIGPCDLEFRSGLYLCNKCRFLVNIYSNGVS